MAHLNWNRRTFLVSSTMAAAGLLPGIRAAATDPVAVVAPQEHPLMAAIAYARNGLNEIESNIADYSCTLVKRERIQGKLADPQYIFTKVRHEPFSVYMYFLGPDKLKGNEVLFVNGHNDGKMWAIAGKGLRRRFGVVSLDPNSAIAMEGQRYPITEVGVRTLIVRLIEVGEHDVQYDECEVKFLQGAKINGRVCTCIQVTHPVERDHFRFYMARIFVDDELQIPIRYAAYHWPTRKSGKPVLDEEYTYLNVKLNNNFTDQDFDYHNENYRFLSK